MDCGCGACKAAAHNCDVVHAGRVAAQHPDLIKACALEPAYNETPMTAIGQGSI